MCRAVRRRPWPSLAQSTNPQRKRLLVPGTLPVSIFEDGAEDYTRKEWEAALDKAKQRTEPDEWPLIIVDDFY